MTMWTKKFWTDTAERMFRSAAHAGLLAIGASEGFDLFTLDVSSFAGFVLGGVVVSFLTAIIAAPVGDPENASFRRED
jgi:hypothetical protein